MLFLFPQKDNPLIFFINNEVHARILDLKLCYKKSISCFVFYTFKPVDHGSFCMFSHSVHHVSLKLLNKTLSWLVYIS